MLNKIIQIKKDNWLQSNDCKVKSIIEYIRKRGEFRESQIQAIETYLFLKLAGENKPLNKLIQEGFFTERLDLNSLNISNNFREFLKSKKFAQSIYEFSNLDILKKTNFSAYIQENFENIDYDKLAKELFYGLNYTDYLFSLPMGAGKTFLMAAIIYLDLYFSINEPNNNLFAKNFLIMIPSGLKSSIVPSLKTIEDFDPAWVLPEPSASNLRRLIKFEVLDQPKSANKSNRTKNPNVQKINKPPFEEMLGYVIVCNAEKVILDRLILTKDSELIEKTEDERDRFANELRNLIGKIPNLQIHIDEVHHAATDDIKLRKVISKWNETGNINAVLGYTGTPYLQSYDKIILDKNTILKFAQITNTVYYYPLTSAIKKFLKKPRVEVAQDISDLSIIKSGIEDFNNTFNEKIYYNGTIPKIAIYCGTIERLEEHIYPYLINELNLNPDEILRFHKGNKKYKYNKENELLFNLLDTAYSKKRYILLVQVGKEGWDCRSLSSVILSQKGDSPNNMVLQTSCRCLRQVEKDVRECAIIWLNKFNADTLNKQLKDEQNTNIEEINQLGKDFAGNYFERTSRVDFLKLPSIDFYQLRVELSDIKIEENANTIQKLNYLLNVLSNIKADSYKINSSDMSVVTTDKTVEYFTEKYNDLFQAGTYAHSNMISDVRETYKTIEEEGSEKANFNKWLLHLSKDSFDIIKYSDLKVHENTLNKIFEKITFVAQDTQNRKFNELFDLELIESKIRLAFHVRSKLEISEETTLDNADLLIVNNNFSEFDSTINHIPNINDTNLILDLDAKNKLIRKMTGEEIDDLGLSNAVINKDRTFHYIPYAFPQSRYEMSFLIDALNIAELRKNKLEIYYNGEREFTNFKIKCYANISSGTNNGTWKYIGRYTPDFVIIKRNDNQIHKALIIETKGKGFAKQEEFLSRQKFIESHFIIENNKRFKYNKFDYLYIEEGDNIQSKLITKINEFFGVENAN